MQMREFLQLVASGQRAFSAKNDSDLLSFQNTARTAQEAYKAGYIGVLKAHNEYETSNRYINMFIVGALTDNGRQLIHTP